MMFIEISIPDVATVNVKADDEDVTKALASQACLDVFSGIYIKPAIIHLLKTGRIEGCQSR